MIAYRCSACGAIVRLRRRPARPVSICCIATKCSGCKLPFDHPVEGRGRLLCVPCSANEINGTSPAFVVVERPRQPKAAFTEGATETAPRPKTTKPKPSAAAEQWLAASRAATAAETTKEKPVPRTTAAAPELEDEDLEEKEEDEATPRFSHH